MLVLYNAGFGHGRHQPCRTVAKHGGSTQLDEARMVPGHSKPYCFLEPIWRIEVLTSRFPEHERSADAV